LAVGVFLLGVAIGTWLREPEPYDLIVSGGRIYTGDGWLAKGQRLGVRNGKVAKIGYLLGGRAQVFLDATGKVVAPGFIDTHVHIEGSMGAMRPLRAENFVRMGATTLITGNCGTSHTHLAEVMEGLSRKGGQLNVATLVGHKTLREAVMKQDPKAEPTADQLEKMKRMLDEQMRQGALGLSTGLEYSPGIFSKEAEVVALAKVVANWKGIYATHLRNEGVGLRSSLDEAIRTSRTAGVHLHVSHLKVACQKDWGSMPTVLQKLSDARADLPGLTGDAYAYMASSSGLDLILPEEYRGYTQNKKELTNNPEACEKFVVKILEHMRAQGFLDFSFARVAWSRDPALRGLTIDQFPESARKGVISDEKLAKTVPDPALRTQVRSVLGLFLQGGGQMVYHVMDDKDMVEALKCAYIVVGSDSSVRSEDNQTSHPRGCGNVPRVLRELVHERHALGLEEALHKMSTQAAEIFKLPGRGRLLPGFAADIVIFDPEAIADKATYDSPVEAPEGIDYVVVNGTVVADHGKVLARYPGMVLRNALVDPGPLLRSDPTPAVASADLEPAPDAKEPPLKPSKAKAPKTHHRKHR
jgi:N-acyl-D-amino-acid deacylase